MQAEAKRPQSFTQRWMDLYKPAWTHSETDAILIKKDANKHAAQLSCQTEQKNIKTVWFLCSVDVYLTNK